MISLLSNCDAHSPHNSRGEQKANSLSGFTLVEVMVSAVILVVVFVSTLGALQTGFRLIEVARNTTMADQILQSEIEDIRLYNWDNISTLETGKKTALTLPSAVQGQFAAFRQITDERWDSELVPKPRLKRIRITVEWTNSNGTASNRSYETIFGKHGINDYFATTRED